MRFLLLYLKKFDWVLMASVLLLLILGIVELYSIALSRGSTDLDNFKKQIIFACLGLLALFLVSLIEWVEWLCVTYPSRLSHL